MLTTLKQALDALYDRRETDAPTRPGSAVGAAPSVDFDDFVEQADVGDVVLFQCNSPHQ